MKKAFTLIEVLVVFIVVGCGVVIPCGYGYVQNIVKVANNWDLEEPSNEIIRSVGVFVMPMGIVLGYIDLEGDKVEEEL